MSIIVLPLLTVVVLAFICIRRERDLRPLQHPYARTIYYTALVLLAVYGLFWLVFGFGEIFAGLVSGLIHVAPALCVALLWVFSHRRPYESGIGLCALGVAQSVFLFAQMGGTLTHRLNTVLLVGLPFVVIGMLLLAASRMAFSPEDQK
jgi:hypothetical protein